MVCLNLKKKQERSFRCELIVDNYLPKVCPFRGEERHLQSEFALNVLKCGINRSSIIRIDYSERSRLINPGENLTQFDVLKQPIIQLNREYLSKINTKSFILILIDPEAIPAMVRTVILHWINIRTSNQSA